MTVRRLANVMYSELPYENPENGMFNLRCFFFSQSSVFFVLNLDFSLITQHIHAHVSMGTQEYRGIGEVTIVTTRPFSQGSENGRCSYDWGR